MPVRMRTIPIDYSGQDAPQRSWGIRNGQMAGRAEMEVGNTSVVATLRADGTVQVRVDRGPETLLEWVCDAKDD